MEAIERTLSDALKHNDYTVFDFGKAPPGETLDLIIPVISMPDHILLRKAVVGGDLFIYALKEAMGQGKPEVFETG